MKTTTSALEQTRPSRALSRRRFLRTAGGLTLGLPLLEGLSPRGARAQERAVPPFLIIIVQGNGVVQASSAIDGSKDGERFWPSQPGTLTQTSLQADLATRATGELSAFAGRLSLVQGVNHPFRDTGCMHATGDAQILTGANVKGQGNRVLGQGESIDTFIARALNPPGIDPLVLHAGRYSAGGTGYDIPGYVSYLGPGQPRSYVDSPFAAYERILGVVGEGQAATPEANAEAQLLANRSRSINDLLRSQIQALLARPDLSASDRTRLDQHFAAIRDIEVGMVDLDPAVSVTIGEERVARMQAIDRNPYSVETHYEQMRLHQELMTFAVASGYTRVAVLKVGDREDDHQLTLNGTNFVYHTASHRGIPNGANLCSQLDFMHMRMFREFLDHISAIETPSGSLLEAGVTVWTNQVATGAHSFVDVPWILAGGASGALRMGQFFKIAAVNTNRMLNTLSTVVGAPVQDFGDSSLPGGLIDDIVT